MIYSHNTLFIKIGDDFKQTSCSKEYEHYQLKFGPCYVKLSKLFEERFILFLRKKSSKKYVLRLERGLEVYKLCSIYNKCSLPNDLFDLVKQTSFVLDITNYSSIVQKTTKFDYEKIKESALHFLKNMYPHKPKPITSIGNQSLKDYVHQQLKMRYR